MTASRALRSLVVPALLLVAGCETQFVTIAPEVSTESATLGHVRGSSTRHILLGTPSYNIIPIGWSGCTSRACEAALLDAPGGPNVALRNVTIEEDWYWWVIGSAREFVIEGDVVAK